MIEAEVIMPAKKTIAIVGATGNQGGSVASIFSKLPGWHVRGLTRDPSKPAYAHLKEQGIELVRAELDDVDSLKKAFAGATVIFGTTDFWQHMSSPSAQSEAAARGITTNEVAYEREIQQGKNIVDAAAATVESLERFVMCTLNESKKWSKGKIDFNLHFDSKWKAVEYCKSTYPNLWAKTSKLQLGYFITNWKSGLALPTKQADGTYKLAMPMGGENKVPMVDPNADTGRFVHALLSLPPDTNLLGCGSKLSWSEYAAIWGRINNVTVTFESYPGFVMEENMGTLGREYAAMFQYMDEFGYDGGDPSVVYPWEAKEKYGVEIQYTTAEEYLKGVDWKSVL
ncbi:hypothetical protein N0V90_006165 [Kalmusia sp. IMI 367209]|nr:hypothetical protein N0V90_006165 [Kalmusia sp. IMI 367209]